MAAFAQKERRPAPGIEVEGSIAPALDWSVPAIDERAQGGAVDSPFDAIRGDSSALIPWMDPDHTLAPVPDDPLSHELNPTRVADSGAHIPVGAKYDPRWQGLAHGPVSESSAPQTVRIPDAVDRGLSESWAATVADPRHQEHGGNVVRTYGGDYKTRHGEPGTARMFEQDEKDVGRTEDLVGLYHTHPYMDEGYDHGTFSGGDFANMAGHDQNVSLLRSGSNSTYMIARTKEFQAQVDAIEKKYDGAALVKHRQDFYNQIESSYDAAYAAALKAKPGDFPAALEAAAIATSQKYHLLYYEGQGQNLHRAGQSAQPNR